MLAQFIGRTLYNVSTAEPLDIAVTLAGLAAGATVASYLPALRATRIDPVQALR